MGKFYRVLEITFVFLVISSTTKSQSLEEYDFDQVITTSEKAIGQGSDEPDVWKKTAQAYYLKGMLLLAAFEANAKLNRLYFACREKEVPAGRAGHYWLFRAMNAVAEDSIPLAIGFLKKSQTEQKDPYWSTVGRIWLGALHSESDNPTLRDKEWARVDWTIRENELERLAAVAILGGTGSAPGKHPDVDVAGPRQARNRILIAGDLKQIDRRERVRLLDALRMGEPVISKKDASFSEDYYDIFALLAGAKCALSIARDIMFQLHNSGSSNSDIGFYIALSSFCIGDDNTVIRTLANEKHKTAPVLLGGSYYRSGDRSQALKMWKRAEETQDAEVRSWLGFVYGVVGYDLRKARELCASAVGRESSQGDWGRLGFVLTEMNETEAAYQAYNLGYNPDRRNEMSVNGNDPAFTVAYCSAAQLVDATHMLEVNQMLLVVREKYPFLAALHETSTGISACKSIVIEH